LHDHPQRIRETAKNNNSDKDNDNTSNNHTDIHNTINNSKIIAHGNSNIRSN